MASKSKFVNIKTLFSLLVGVPTLFNLISKAFNLIGLEAKLAGRGVFTMIMFFVVLTVVGTTIWLGFSTLCLFYLLSLNWGILGALGLVILINVLLLLILILFTQKCKNQLLFPETRRRIQHARSMYEDL